LMCNNRKALLAIVGLNHLIAVQLQTTPKHYTTYGVIIDHQHHGSVSLRGRRAHIGTPCSSCASFSFTRAYSALAVCTLVAAPSRFPDLHINSRSYDVAASFLMPSTAQPPLSLCDACRSDSASLRVAASCIRSSNGSV